MDVNLAKGRVPNINSYGMLTPDIEKVASASYIDLLTVFRQQTPGPAASSDNNFHSSLCVHTVSFHKKRMFPRVTVITFVDYNCWLVGFIELRMTSHVPWPYQSSDMYDAPVWLLQTGI